jgi:hypothetical protein
MDWLAGLLVAVIVVSSIIVGRERLARRRRDRLIRSSIEPSHRRTQRSEMRGDSHHDTVVGMMGTTSKSPSSKSSRSKTANPRSTSSKSTQRRR